MVWIAVLEAYNKTIDAAFRLADWFKGRPVARLQDKRKELEEASREAQIKGDVNEMVRIRSEIEDIDRKLLSGNVK